MTDEFREFDDSAVDFDIDPSIAEYENKVADKRIHNYLLKRFLDGHDKTSLEDVANMLDRHPTTPVKLLDTLVELERRDKELMDLANRMGYIAVGESFRDNVFILQGIDLKTLKTKGVEWVLNTLKSQIGDKTDQARRYLEILLKVNDEER